MEKLILISNDDGVQSVGLAALARAMQPLGRVVVVAPDRERSAASHSISLASPLRMQEVQKDWYAVDGTPTDCAYIGIHHVVDRKPDLLVSGINLGANLGNDVTYSGTVAAAMEATLFGVPSIAFSQISPRKLASWDPTAEFCTRVARWVLENRLPKDTLLNVNFPAQLDPKRYAWTMLGKRKYGEVVDVRVDPRGRKYYWIGGDDIGHEDKRGSDVNAIADGFITISPVHMDLTHYEALNMFAAATF